MPGQGDPRFRPAQGNAGNWRPGWRSSSSDRVVNRWDSDVGARVRPTSSHRLLPTPRCPVVVDATSVAIRDDTPTSMGPMPCLHRHRRPWDVFCLRPTRMPLIPPRGRHPATSAECSEPVSKTNSGTSRECSQSAVKLTAGLEPGQAGPAGQCTSTPLVKLGATCVSAETQTALLIVERGQPVVNFLDIAECPFVDNIPNCFPLGDDLVFTRSPWVPVIIEGVHVPMLLDRCRSDDPQHQLSASSLSRTGISRPGKDREVLRRKSHCCQRTCDVDNRDLLSGVASPCLLL